MSTTILICVGTRPEAIKMAPVIRRLQNSSLKVITLFTGQHRELVRDILEQFGCSWDYELEGVMVPGQSLAALTSKIFDKLETALDEIKPNAVLAQGDTTTVMVTGMACFYKKIPFGHVEAGLRTHNLYGPFPEEYNRRVASLTAKWHFCPTNGAANNLHNEQVDSQAVLTTGNTVIDALLYIKSKIEAEGLPSPAGTRVLLTCHRRENFGQPLESIFSAINGLCSEFSEIEFIYPVHPNPNVKEPALKFFKNHPQVKLCDPLSYTDLVREMMLADFMLTDSGGIQEEAPALGKPVIVLREETERPEAVDAGAAVLVGADKEKILHICRSLIAKGKIYEDMSRPCFPYGEGVAADKIVERLEKDLLKNE